MASRKYFHRAGVRSQSVRDPCLLRTPHSRSCVSLGTVFDKWLHLLYLVMIAPLWVEGGCVEFLRGARVETCQGIDPVKVV